MSLFNGFWGLYFEVVRMSRESQRQRLVEWRLKEHEKRFHEMEERINALECSLKETIEQSRQHRKEFRKRQEKRQTAAVIKEVTSKIINN